MPSTQSIVAGWSDAWDGVITIMSSAQGALQTDDADVEGYIELLSANLEQLKQSQEAAKVKYLAKTTICGHPIPKKRLFALLVTAGDFFAGLGALSVTARELFARTVAEKSGQDLSSADQKLIADWITLGVMAGSAGVSKFKDYCWYQNKLLEQKLGTLEKVIKSGNKIAEVEATLEALRAAEDLRTTAEQLSEQDLAERVEKACRVPLSFQESLPPRLILSRIQKGKPFEKISRLHPQSKLGKIVQHVMKKEALNGTRPAAAPVRVITPLAAAAPQAGGVMAGFEPIQRRGFWRALDCNDIEMRLNRAQTSITSTMITAGDKLKSQRVRQESGGAGKKLITLKAHIQILRENHGLLKQIITRVEELKAEEEAAAANAARLKWFRDLPISSRATMEGVLEGISITLGTIDKLGNLGANTQLKTASTVFWCAGEVFSWGSGALSNYAVLEEERKRRIPALIDRCEMLVEQVESGIRFFHNYEKVREEDASKSDLERVVRSSHNLPTQFQKYLNAEYLKRYPLDSGNQMPGYDRFLCRNLSMPDIDPDSLLGKHMDELRLKKPAEGRAMSLPSTPCGAQPLLLTPLSGDERSAQSEADISMRRAPRSTGSVGRDHQFWAHRERSRVGSAVFPFEKHLPQDDSSIFSHSMQRRPGSIFPVVSEESAGDSQSSERVKARAALHHLAPSDSDTDADTYRAGASSAPEMYSSEKREVQRKRGQRVHAPKPPADVDYSGVFLGMGTPMTQSSAATFSAAPTLSPTPTESSPSRRKTALSIQIPRRNLTFSAPPSEDQTPPSLDPIEIIIGDVYGNMSEDTLGGEASAERASNRTGDESSASAGAAASAASGAARTFAPVVSEAPSQSTWQRIRRVISFQKAASLPDYLEEAAVRECTYATPPIID